MTALGTWLAESRDLVADYRVLDLVDLGALQPGSFDAVVCVGGPLSYLLDKESAAVTQLLRIVRPGGIVVLGVMSLINTVVLFMDMLPAEKQAIGMDTCAGCSRQACRTASTIPRQSTTAT